MESSCSSTPIRTSRLDGEHLFSAGVSDFNLPGGSASPALRARTTVLFKRILTRFSGAIEAAVIGLRRDHVFSGVAGHGAGNQRSHQ